MPISRYTPEHELYGILGDKDAYRQLEHQHDSEALGRYPSFYPQEGSSPSPSHKPVMSEDKRYSDTMQAKKSRQRLADAQSDYLSPQKTGATDYLSVPGGSNSNSWYDQDVEPAKISKATSRLARNKPLAPSRPTPPAPSDFSAPASYASPSASGLTMSEPSQPFARAVKPKKSALKGSNVGSTAPSGLSAQSAVSAPADLYSARSPGSQQPAPLPPTAFLSPASAQKRRMELARYGPGSVPPSAMRPPSREAPSSYWQSPPTSQGRLSSTGGSHRGSSAATSSVAFTSSSFSNSYSHGSTSASNTSPYVPASDGEPDESPAPRSTLFVVNADPVSSESEQSLPLPLAARYGPPTQAKPAGRPRSHQKSPSAPPSVPPVPSVPPQFKAPPPPNFPPPGSNESRSRSAPSVPVFVNSERDRGIPKRHASDGNSKSSQPRPVHSSSRKSRSSGAPGSLRRSDSDTSSSSSGSSASPHTPPTHTAPQAAIPTEWVHPLPLTLEQLFRGGKHEFRITRHMLDGSKKDTTVLVDVQPGWKSGTRITFPGAGNERAPGQYQDVIFVVEQIHHERFARLDGGRLIVTEEIPLPEALNPARKLYTRMISGLDGKVIEFVAPSCIIKNGMETVVKGHGMYLRSKSQVIGRGDLVIRWSVRVPQNLTPAQYEQMREIFSK
ncbi:hypothetical protein FRB96_004504 [Tulasnella sp. 330]|nr:hypothetical protein FRB96_004504 [Tulasnella sp. 330]KAG8886340.1 hypothetical protein FRB97_004875 [Tulasnella sp. 331]KAG8890792.1 hypothetical protein FRB98_004837 [Tulasnella sp. 332]